MRMEGCKRRTDGGTMRSPERATMLPSLTGRILYDGVHMEKHREESIVMV
jgi:hypothetical protein